MPFSGALRLAAAAILFGIPARAVDVAPVSVNGGRSIPVVSPFAAFGPAVESAPAGLLSPGALAPGLSHAPSAPALSLAAAAADISAVPVAVSAALTPRTATAARVVAARPASPLAALKTASLSPAAIPEGRSVSVEAARAAADASFDGTAVRPENEAEPVPGALSRAAVLPAASAPEPLAPKNPPAPGRSARRFVWPASVGAVWISWAAAMTALGHWGLFAHNWFMSVTMAFGSFVAGATSEGGGAVSFPVMTLLFHVPPPVARDFALMIQSVGMTTAALTILAMKISVEKRVLLWGILGGAVGMALGVTFIAPLFAPAFAKMFFTSLWAAFALSHFMAARRRGAAVESLGALGKKDVAAMIAFGVIGGVVSSIVGTGLCMVMFTLLTLGYRLSEKVATPTSVILMASNALFGFLWKGAVLGGMAAQAWNYWWVCVPIVVVGAPLGARFIAGRSRQFVSRILYATISIQLAAALFIVHQTPLLLATSAATFLIGAGIFRLMARRGDAAAEKKA